MGPVNSLTSATQLYFRLDAARALLFAGANRLEELGDATLAGAMHRQITLLDETCAALVPDVQKEQMR